jgi:hypothetical protein
MIRQTLIALFLILMIAGCGETDRTGAESEASGRSASASSSQHATAIDPEDPTLLARPFTADEIRNEWVEGFQLTIRRSGPDGEGIERWTVVAADSDGAEIEYATLDENGKVEGEPTVRRSEWVELRDHASFPAENATREWVSRHTALGDHEGWLYRVPDESGSVSEYFFVPLLPGAPVEMRILDGEDTVFSLHQLDRSRPEGP